MLWAPTSEHTGRPPQSWEWPRWPRPARWLAWLPPCLLWGSSPLWHPPGMLCWELHGPVSLNLFLIPEPVEPGPATCRAPGAHPDESLLCKENPVPLFSAAFGMDIFQTFLSPMTFISHNQPQPHTKSSPQSSHHSFRPLQSCAASDTCLPLRKTTFSSQQVGPGEDWE